MPESHSIEPEFCRCLMCGGIMQKWEDQEGFCLACLRTGEKGDDNVVHTWVAQKLNGYIRNREDARAVQTLILAMKQMGVDRVQTVLDMLKGMI